MLLHPLFTTVVRHPHLVAEHFGGYAALVREEATATGEMLVRRAIGGAIALVSISIALILAGTAVMLGVMDGRFHWVLIVVPVVALIPALFGWNMVKEPIAQPVFAVVATQFEADVAALRAAGERRER